MNGNWDYIEVILGEYRENGRKVNRTQYVIGLYWGNVEITAKKMETTILQGCIGGILG